MNSQTLIKALKAFEAEQKRFNKMSARRRNMNVQNSTPKAIQNMEANLNWSAMDLEKRKIDIARAFKGSEFDVSTEKTEFNPSPFHKYTY